MCGGAGRWGYRSAEELAEVAANYSAAGLPLEVLNPNPGLPYISHSLFSVSTPGFATLVTTPLALQPYVRALALHPHHSPSPGSPLLVAMPLALPKCARPLRCMPGRLGLRSRQP